MTRQRSRTHLLNVAALGLALLLAMPISWAHKVDETVLRAPVVPTDATPTETVAGTLDQLVVDNRVTNATTRYLAIQSADGETTALSGGGLDGFAQDTYVVASGRRNGNTLFVTSVRAEAPPSQLNANINKSSKANVSGPAMQAQGTLLLAHSDDFATGKSAFHFVVRGDAGQMTQLKLAVTPEVLQPGTSVIATGIQAEDGFSLSASHIVIVALPKAESRNQVVAKATTTNNVLVVLVKFSDSPATDPFTQAQVQQVMTTNATSVVNYYSETSYGQHLLNVTVTPWLASPQATPANCDYNTIATYGTAAANVAGYNVGASPSAGGPYQNVYYVFPQQSACGWAGLAYIGYGQAFANGYNLLPVFAHELGHNFGLLHAASLNCNGQPITSGATGCTSSEYGDPFTAMGGQSTGSYAMQFNAAQKAKLGWIPSSSVATYASGTATYTLTPLETGGGTTYAVKVQAAASRTFWLEYRQRIGSFDTALTYATNGAQVRVASPFQSICAGCADDTELLYMPTGSPGNFYNSALLVGQSFSDSGITMSVLSATASALTVQVSSGSPPATTTSIASSLNPSTTGAPVTITATVTGASPTGTVNFKDGTTSITGCSASAVSGTGNARAATCAIGALAVGTHNITASYSGDGGNGPSTSPTLAQVVNAPAGASTTTTLASSGTPSLAGSNVTFMATVTGAAPTGTVSFSDGGTAITGCAAAAVSGSGNSRSAACSTTALSVGAHSIVATYSGDAGNAGSSSAVLTQTISASNNIAMLVDHYYLAILARAADPGGEAFWENEAVRMQALGVDIKEAYMVMAGYFFSGAEYLSRNTSDTQYVTDLYNTFFNRPPDPGGLSYWTGQIAAGVPRSIVLYGFLFSPEFNSYMTGLFGNTSSRPEVSVVVDFYRGILNRLPDTAGFNNWLTQFRSAQCTGAGPVYTAVDQISSSFIYGTEYVSRNRTNAQYVGDLYYAFLRRGGDVAGVSYWINQLNSGAETREQLRKDFINTPEFNARVNAIVAQGCLP